MRRSCLIQSVFVLTMMSVCACGNKQGGAEHHTVGTEGAWNYFPTADVRCVK